jgi:hypothetical protein
MTSYWGLQAKVANTLHPIDTEDFKSALKELLNTQDLSPELVATTAVILAMNYAVSMNFNIDYYVKPTLEDDRCRKLLGL